MHMRKIENVRKAAIDQQASCQIHLKSLEIYYTINCLIFSPKIFTYF